MSSSDERVNDERRRGGQKRPGRKASPFGHAVLPEVASQPGLGRVPGLVAHLDGQPMTLADPTGFSGNTIGITDARSASMVGKACRIA